MKRINKQGGFTLLELLVVVAIIAIIAGAVISAISGQEERAGQGVALHTMGALENVVRQDTVINGGLPSALDSLLCADTDTAPTSTAGLTNVALLPTLADGLAGKLVAVTIPQDADTTDDDIENAEVIREAGITSLRYAITEACDNDTGTTASPIGQNDTVGDTAANELLANTLFWDADTGGGGSAVDLASGSAVNLAIFTEPDDIGQTEDTVVAVFGVGNQSSLVIPEDNNTKMLSRGPIDGNVDGNGERYSHFSIAVKIGENAPTLDQAGIDNAATEFEADEVDVVAILDSDGDGFDDEVAEFAGLEDE